MQRPNLRPPSRPPAPARRPPLRQASGPPPPPQNPLPPRPWAGGSATAFRPGGHTASAAVSGTDGPVGPSVGGLCRGRHRRLISSGLRGPATGRPAPGPVGWARWRRRPWALRGPGRQAPLGQLLAAARGPAVAAFAAPGLRGPATGSPAPGPVGWARWRRRPWALRGPGRQAPRNRGGHGEHQLLAAGQQRRPSQLQAGDPSGPANPMAAGAAFQTQFHGTF